MQQSKSPWFATFLWLKLCYWIHKVQVGCLTVWPLLSSAEKENLNTRYILKCCGALVTFDCSYDGFGIVKMKMFWSTTTLAKVGPPCHFLVLFLSVQTHAVTLKKGAAVFKVWSITGKWQDYLLIEQREVRSLKLGLQFNNHLMLIQNLWVLSCYSTHYKALQDTILSCNLTAVCPPPVCSHCGSRCPIFRRVLADKVTQLIDVSLQDPFLRIGSPPISILKVLQKGVPRGPKNFSKTSCGFPGCSLSGDSIYCIHSSVTSGCNFSLCPFLENNTQLLSKFSKF